MRKLIYRMAISRMQKVVNKYATDSKKTEEEVHKKLIETAQTLSKEFEIKMINEDTNEEYTDAELGNMSNEQLLKLNNEAMEYIKNQIYRLKQEES